MVAATKFNTFVESLAEGLIDLDNHTMRVMLTNTLPAAATALVRADITQIAAGTGYVANGVAIVLASSAQVSGTYRYIVNDVNPAWTATGVMGPFRYYVLIDDTTDRLICFWDRGASITLASGDTIGLNFDGTNGVLSIA